MAIKVRGSRYFDKQPGMRAWCRYVTRYEDLNLNESGAYAFATPFVAIDKRVELAPDQFLLVACEQPDPDAPEGKRYQFALLSGEPEKNFDGQDEPRVIPHSAVRQVAHNLLRKEAVIPDHKRAQGRDNLVYQMAAYCAAFYLAGRNLPPATLAANVKYRGLPNTLRPDAPPAAGGVPAHVRVGPRPRRRIDANLVAEPEPERKETPRAQAPQTGRPPPPPPRRPRTPTPDALP